MNRRQAIFLSGATLSSQRLAPVDELVNLFEMEEMAKRVLAPALYTSIAGSDRSAFDRITLRPRLMVNTTGIDLSLTLFGDRLFAPILVGPTERQGQYHSDAELGMVKGAGAAKAAVVFAAKTSMPIDEVANEAETPFWVQVDPAPVPRVIPAAAKALVFTLQGKPFDWTAFDRIRTETKKPGILKGIMSAKDAQLAMKRGVDGLIVSNYRTRPVPGFSSPIEALPAIAAEVANKVPILIDGSFRRGSDILKALALGARAVLLGRPPLWGLAAYGASGVQQVIEQLQTELARDMAMCGKVTLAQLGPDAVRLHRR